MSLAPPDAVQENSEDSIFKILSERSVKEDIINLGVRKAKESL